MYTIYEYSHDSISAVELAYLVATSQPLAGGADAEESARIIVPVHRVASLDEAREWIAATIPAAVRRLTADSYTVTEKPHSQAALCIVAETEYYDA